MITTYVTHGPRAELYIDGCLVEYTEFTFTDEICLDRDFFTPRPLPKWRIVLASGQVINVSTEQMKLTFNDGQAPRIDLQVG